MKKLRTVFLVYLILFLVSWKKESLQNYLFECENRKEVTSLNIPISIIELAENNLNAEEKAIYKTIRKVNFTGFLAEKIDESTYEIEKNRVKKILGSSSYKKLIGFNDNGNSFSFYRIANSDTIDEIIVFGYGKEQGIGIARILGDDMKPEKIISLLKSSKINFDSLGI